MTIQVKNNAVATIAAGISDVSTEISVATGFGALFPSASGADFFYATLFNDAGDTEIVKCTQRVNDVMTVVRAQDGTAARAWLAATTRIEVRVVAAMFEYVRDLSEQASTDSTSAVSTAGTALSTANSAASDASTALSTANAASDIANQAAEGWIEQAETIVSSTGTTIVVDGNRTGVYLQGRPIRVNQSGSQVGRVLSAVYGAPNTTITVEGFTVSSPTAIEAGILSAMSMLPGGQLPAAITVETKAQGDNSTAPASTAYADAAAGSGIANFIKDIATSRWTDHAAPFGASAYRSGIAYSPSLNRFVLTGYAGSTSTVATSCDGKNWTARTAISSNEWNAVAWSPSLSLFAAVSGGTSTSNCIMTSPDGITWTARSLSATKNVTDIIWCDTLSMFVAVCTDSAPGQRFITSPDGINWTFRSGSVSTPGGIRSITWSAELGMLVAVGDGPDIERSTDGITWTSVAVPGGHLYWHDVAWSPSVGKFVAIRGAGGGSNNAMWSSDGTTWTVISIPLVVGRGIEWSEYFQKYVAVGSNNGSTTIRASILTSDDGITWTAVQDNGSCSRVRYFDHIKKFIVTSTGSYTYHSL